MADIVSIFQNPRRQRVGPLCDCVSNCIFVVTLTPARKTGRGGSESEPLAKACAVVSPYASTSVVGGAKAIVSPSCAFMRSIIAECIWLTRDSDKSSVAPISFIVICS